jgi:3-hydroxybutyryl-CoA dehydrogenase
MQNRGNMSTKKEKICILGTGSIGPTVAVQFIKANYKTTVWSRSQEGTDKGKRDIEQYMTDLLNYEVISEADVQRALSNVEYTNNLEKAVEAADFISESIIENLEVKQDLFARLESICGNRPVFASNTSAIMPTLLNQKMKDKTNLLVAHFWNPAYLATLVEVCGSDYTSMESIELTMKLLKDIGNEPVHMKKEIPGFICNRIMHAMNREALSLIQKGVLTAEEVDKAIRSSFGPRFANLGLMEFNDFVGLDLVRSVEVNLHPDLDNTPGPMPILDEKIQKNERGYKSGTGFYDWTGKDVSDIRKRRDKVFISNLKEQSKKAE